MPSYLYDPAAPKPGQYSGVDIDVYHGSAGVSSTGLHACISRSPAHYRHDKDHPVHRDYFDIGNATHVAILEPEDLDRRIHVLPYANFSTKAARIERDRAREVYPTKYLLTEPAYDDVIGMRNSVLSAQERYGMDIDPAALLHAGDFEQTFVSVDEATGTIRRARPDAIIREQKLIVDLKTSHDAHPRAFSKKRRDMGYDLSAAFHLDTACAAMDEDPAEWSYVWVVVEKSEPYVVGMFDAAPDLLAVGRAKYRRALELVETCTRTGIWPPYSTALETLTPATFERDALPTSRISA